MPQCVMEGELDMVELVPFAHQVGGHSTVLRYNNTTVCKALILRELQFYKTMPAEMRAFTPQYRGVIEVSAHTDSDGYVTLVARRPNLRRNSLTSSLPNLSEEIPMSATASLMEANEAEDVTLSDSETETNTDKTSRLQHRFRIRRTGSVEIEGLCRGLSELELLGEEDGVYATNHNTWSLRCHKENLARMKNEQQDQYLNKFLLLENLTCNMKQPCILDLKMGTRQHGDDASEEKKASQMTKCHMTTSCLLGLRICGMQVYQASTGKYICHNKYYGRRLDLDGVRDALRQFLHNGVRLHVELIQPIVQRLRELLAVLSDQNTFRFYSSSLLIMYDGAECSKSCVESKTSSCVAKAPSDPSRSVAGTSSCVQDVSKAANTSSVGQAATDDGESNGVSAQRVQQNCAMQQCAAAKINIRMIDFAHVTHRGFLQDKTAHVGPDHGYLFGLGSLINLFEEMQESHQLGTVIK